MESVTNSYASKIEILQFPDDYVARPQFFDEQSKLAVKENGRFIVKAGTPFPSNDEQCTGIVLNDLDVTNGDTNGAVLVRGHINTARAEENFGETYTQACKNALKGVYFYPLGGEVTEKTVIDTRTKIAVDAKDPVVVVELEGTDFAPKQASQKVSNYEITTDDTGLTVANITRTGDKTVKVAFTGTATAGTLKIKALEATVLNGLASNELEITIA
jgi:hypothetical protein